MARSINEVLSVLKRDNLHGFKCTKYAPTVYIFAFASSSRFPLKFSFEWARHFSGAAYFVQTLP